MKFILNKEGILVLKKEKPLITIAKTIVKPSNLIKLILLSVLLVKLIALISLGGFHYAFFEVLNIFDHLGISHFFSEPFKHIVSLTQKI